MGLCLIGVKDHGACWTNNLVAVEVRSGDGLNTPDNLLYWLYS